MTSEQEDQSLATLLTTEQRGELTVLIANTTEQMRNDLIKIFEFPEMPSPPPDKAEIEAKTKTQAAELQDNEAQSQSPNQQLPPTDEANACSRLRATRELELPLSAPKVQALRSAALDYFDTWRDSVILRVGEVVNTRNNSGQSKDGRHAEKVVEKGDNSNSSSSSSSSSDDGSGKTPTQTATDEALHRIYAPQPTPLAQLPRRSRRTILNAVLLLLLSLESYKAHSRTLLLRLCTSLHVTSAEATGMETEIARGLLSAAAAAAQMDGAGVTAAAAKAKGEANAGARRWKVGLASVAGAALIGVTGGLAAPLVAAGVGGLMGGLGLGATAAAGYLGTLAGSGVLVGGLFGAYGGRMTGRMMDAYAREVEDFAFVPVRGGGGKEDEKEAKERRRLRVTIGVTGWLTTKEEVVTPWRVLGDGGEPFALRWELQALLNLGNALQGFVSSYAWGYIKKEIIKRTILAGLWSALMLPIGLLKISKVVDNPFSVAKARADKAGEVLADALIERAQGERPVSLVGYSLGGRVIYSCLLALAKRKAFGVVESVVVMGAPTPSDTADWRSLRSVVSGRLINVYSENDYILAFLYRTSSVQLGVAGLQAVQAVHGVENVDMSASVSGHLRYQHLVGSILAKVGWSDVDEDELHHQEVVLQQLAAEDKKRQEAEEKEEDLDEKKLEEEAARLESTQAAPTPKEKSDHDYHHLAAGSLRQKQPETHG